MSHPIRRRCGLQRLCAVLVPRRACLPPRLRSYPSCSRVPLVRRLRRPQFVDAEIKPGALPTTGDGLLDEAIEFAEFAFRAVGHPAGGGFEIRFHLGENAVFAISSLDINGQLCCVGHC